MTYKQSHHIATPSSQTLGLHRGSRTISKIQQEPKIRIIHMYAPEIINVDVSNFRELVQRLTGMPTSLVDNPKGTYTNKGKDKGEYDQTNNNNNNNNRRIDDVAGRDRVSTKLEAMMMGSTTLPSSSYADDDQGFWRTTAVDLKNTASCGGFLNAFSELDDNFDLNMMLTNTMTSNINRLNSSCGENSTTQLSFRG
ncbi:hypothetical protein vseg_008159 [Gypsophila vaccaria]